MQYPVSPCGGRTQFAAGFTLLELLIVLLIVSVMLATIGLQAGETNAQLLRQDARRLAALMQLARDEAIVRNRVIALELDSERYHFLIKQDNGWENLQSDELLREREFKPNPVLFSIQAGKDKMSTWRMLFGREPVDKPFVLTLQHEQNNVNIHADGIGHFRVK